MSKRIGGGYWSGFLGGAVITAALMSDCHSAKAAPIRVASYASQRSSGAPLVVMPPAINAGAVDTAAVRYLSRYDDVTLELTPWAHDVNGQPRADVPLMLRSLNPRIRLWLYVLAGDQWLPPTFRPSVADKSAFAAAFNAVNAGNGWLYGTDGAQWMPDGQKNYRVNLADSTTVARLGDVYASALSTHLFDGIFLDCAHTSIAWTSKPDRRLDVARAGFATLAAMDSARLANVERLIARLKAAQPCLLVAFNGTGPMPAGADVRMQEGIGRLVTAREAVALVKGGGTWHLKAECYSPVECQARLSMLRGIAVFAKGEVIISCGGDRAWPPVGR